MPVFFDPANHILARHSDPAHPIWTKFCLDILLDPRNKPAEQFFIYSKIQDGRRWSKVQNRPNLTPQITFGPAFGSCSSNLDKKWHRYTV